MIRAVLDTNVVVSSFLHPSGVPSQIRRAWENNKFELSISEPLFREYVEVLGRPVIRQRLKVEPDEIERFLELVAETSVWPSEDLEVVPVVVDDPDDDIVLATAVANRADVIVSGDRHLLELNPHRGIPILTPRQLLESLTEME